MNRNVGHNTQLFYLIDISVNIKNKDFASANKAFKRLDISEKKIIIGIAHKQPIINYEMLNLYISWFPYPYRMLDF